MLTYIYRSEKKANCYLYLNAPAADFELPAPVIRVVGELVLVMELDLTADTKLALVDSEEVLASMNEQGFYIQMPSNVPHPVDVLFGNIAG